MEMGWGLGDRPRTIDDARAMNARLYGDEAQARAEAEDTGGEYCPRCGAVYLPLPGFRDGGHQCLRDGTAAEFMITG
ncbi:hypothetical protein BF93_16515 [Brachybacterium phenoliresistens]|uniref:Uncharacterized protein n=1 Tax=Brachybacterium phenoliresistens TaxID=396014 RepID=Z9JTK8_9MICO|nr:hypothetical protein BF93_16515 [Brachybacterium phenoliresistens]